MQNPDRKPVARSVFSDLAIPHNFKPELSFGQALFAIGGSLARIFGACLLFAVWGGFTALVWNAIGSRFWHAVVALPLLLLFFVTLWALLAGVSTIERWILPKPHEPSPLD